MISAKYPYLPPRSKNRRVTLSNTPTVEGYSMDLIKAIDNEYDELYCDPFFKLRTKKQIKRITQCYFSQRRYLHHELADNLVLQG